MDIDELRELRDKLCRESNDLANKILKLEDALFSQRDCEKFTKNQISLLYIQLHSMKVYYRVLCARIEDIDDRVIELED